jgi:hypothetical protein
MRARNLAMLTAGLLACEARHVDRHGRIISTDSTPSMAPTIVTIPYQAPDTTKGSNLSEWSYDHIKGGLTRSVKGNFGEAPPLVDSVAKLLSYEKLQTNPFSQDGRQKGSEVHVGPNHYVFVLRRSTLIFQQHVNDRNAYVIVVDLDSNRITEATRTGRNNEPLPLAKNERPHDILASGIHAYLSNYDKRH